MVVLYPRHETAMKQSNQLAAHLFPVGSGRYPTAVPRRCSSCLLNLVFVIPVAIITAAAVHVNRFPIIGRGVSHDALWRGYLVVVMPGMDVDSKSSTYSRYAVVDAKHGCLIERKHV